MDMMHFREQILLGIPDKLPELNEYDSTIHHAPKRKDIVTLQEKKLAVHNALPACATIHK